MFLLVGFYFLFFIYCILNYLQMGKICETIVKYFSYKSNINDNVNILKILKYYNLNIYSTINNIIPDCIHYLLFSHTPSYNNRYFFEFEYFSNFDVENEIELLYNNFEIYCAKSNKNKLDLPVNEIIDFIKASSLYKNLDVIIKNRYKRAIILSKYINNNNTQELINALTLNELEILEDYMYRQTVKDNPLVSNVSL